MRFEISFSDKHPQRPMIIISGSFHKLKNNGEHNHNSFSINELQYVAYSFCEKFQINVNQWRVSQVEIGLNILMPFEPNRSLFKRFKVLHGDGGSVIPATFSSKKRKLFDLGFEFNPSTQYALKCYGKNITKMLRIETSVSKMQVLSCEGLQHLKLTHLIDFLMPDKLKALFNVLVLDTFEKILIDEDIPEQLLNPKEQKFCKEAMNFDFWNELNPNDKAYRKKKIDLLMKKHGSYTIKKDIIKELNKELMISLTTDSTTAELLSRIETLEFLISKNQKFISDYYTIEGNLILKNNWTNKLNHENKLINIIKNSIKIDNRTLFDSINKSTLKTSIISHIKACNQFVYKEIRWMGNKINNALYLIKTSSIAKALFININ